ncbi:EscU/YscU/HrcU family type III secretion system export apparatus switch protein [Vibrio sp. Of7-15]|uniref:EscU/YscU/HrcU family type III secretion system export apparatus switch protein n=1 Tax=Vibrio sp. Of7-15 TaxID=2724879 RepID=UPI001EF356E8|nr:EscU/YscU/HrcU family type III secretion system export apparatus switch protein [Vibrio sp. Of7-15]
MKKKSAVAIGYDGISTPTVKARGVDHVAENIIEQVKQQGGLIHQDPVLSQWLEHLNIGDEIPQELYLVIAELIAFAWILEGKTPPGWEGVSKKV